MDDETQQSEYLTEYLSEHDEKSFSMEKVLSRERRQVELESVERFDPGHILEVGCGLDPLFQYTDETRTHTVVDPVEEFIDNAAEIATSDRVATVHGRIQDVTPELNEEYDLIVLSSLLHEVPDPEDVLSAVHSIAGEQTKVHVNVPNVRSFHRLLAYEMGLIDTIEATSELEERFKRHTHFDEASFKSLLRNCGFTVEEFDTYFIKPFSNAQLEEIIDEEIVDRSLIRGLRRMSEHLPGMGAEMYAGISPN